MLFYIALLFLLFLVLAVKNLRAASLLIIALLPSYLIRFTAFDFPSTLLEGLILIAMAVWFFGSGWKIMRDRCFAKTSQGQKFLDYPFKWEIVAVLALMAFLIIEMLLAFSNGTGASQLRELGIIKAYFLEPIMLFVVVINIFRKKDDW